MHCAALQTTVLLQTKRIGISPQGQCGTSIRITGIAAIFSDSLITFGGQSLTANIVTMSVFGAIVMYIMSMASLFKLRASEPRLERTFMAPVYPWFPAIALIGALICLGTMAYYNTLVAEVFVGLMAVGYAYFLTTGKRRAEMLAVNSN